VSLVVFPRITKSPEERVSDDLVQAVLACPGLIYVSTHFSASFWVEFEREIALRSNRAVFEFDPETDRIEVCEAEPREVRVTAVLAPADGAYVREVSRWLKTERNLQVDIPAAPARIGEHDLEVPSSVWSSESIRTVFVLFLSRTALDDRPVMKAFRALLKAPWQTVVVRLEEVEDRDIVRALMRPFREADVVDKAYRSILSRLRMIDVFQDVRVSDHINWNRADDLMVRIFYQTNPARLMQDRRNHWDDAEYLRGIPADWLQGE
jgi:hypothetical protein